jgi:hypothetical protein
VSDIFAGQILRASHINDALNTYLTLRARGVIGHEPIDGDQLVANADSPFLVGQVSFNNDTPDRWLEISWHGNISSSLAGDTIHIDITDEIGGDPIGQAWASISENDGLHPASIVIVKSSNDFPPGFNTLGLYAWRPFGLGTGGFVASSSRPAHFVVKDVGPQT